MSNNNIADYIQDQINKNKIVLFMKGSADFPQCGFSSVVVNILQKIGVTFKDINVLDSMELREGIKIFSDWPTIPQLYVNGEFIGGSDIVKELYSSGELEQIISQK